MFDPFRDFSTAGYLHNKHKERDARIVKKIEHEVFIRHLPEAIQHLSNKKPISYEDFLSVHRILFSEFYPWAGQDRSITAPNIGISKAGIQFCQPEDIGKAVDEGLRLAQGKGKMSESPGLVMGFFAYGHPFLDGNGRTMLLVHLELAYRAGFSIAWADTSKADYLAALSDEIKKPGRGTLDAYLLPFKGDRLKRSEWGKSVLSIKGLDGLDEDNQIDGDLADAAVAEKYRQFEQQRGYAYEASGEVRVCEKCKANPCICRDKKPHKPSG
ncbi:MAG: Fic family protein [Acidiferrobacter sp.]